MKVLKAFLKLFEAPQRTVKIEFKLIFILITFTYARGGKG